MAACSLHPTPTIVELHGPLHTGPLSVEAIARSRRGGAETFVSPSAIEELVASPARGQKAICFVTGYQELVKTPGADVAKQTTGLRSTISCGVPSGKRPLVAVLSEALSCEGARQKSHGVSSANTGGSRRVKASFRLSYFATMDQGLAAPIEPRCHLYEAQAHGTEAIPPFHETKESPLSLASRSATS